MVRNLYFLGGCTSLTNTSSRMERYDVKANCWKLMSSMNERRFEPGKKCIQDYIIAPSNCKFYYINIKINYLSSYFCKYICTVYYSFSIYIFIITYPVNKINIKN